VQRYCAVIIAGEVQERIQSAISQVPESRDLRREAIEQRRHHGHVRACKRRGSGGGGSREFTASCRSSKLPLSPQQTLRPDGRCVTSGLSSPALRQTTMEQPYCRQLHVNSPVKIVWHLESVRWYYLTLCADTLGVSLALTVDINRNPVSSVENTENLQVYIQTAPAETVCTPDISRIRVNCLELINMGKMFLLFFSLTGAVYALHSCSTTKGVGTQGTPRLSNYRHNNFAAAFALTVYCATTRIRPKW